MAVRAAVAILPVVAWQSYGAWVKRSDQYKHPAYPYQRADYMYYNVGYAENMTYVDPFKPELGRISAASWAERVAANVADVPVVLGEAVSTTSVGWELWVQKLDQRMPAVQIPAWSVRVGMSLFGLLVGAGVVLFAVRGEWLMALYCVCSVGLICLTPWRSQFARYLTPSTAPLAIALFLLLLTVRHRVLLARGERWRRPLDLAFAGIALFLIGQQAYLTWQNFRRKHQVAYYYDDRGERRPYRLIFYDDKWRRHDEGLDWLKRRVGPNDVVASVTPFTFYLATGTKSVMPPFEADVRREQQFLDAVPVTFVVVDNLDFLDVARRYVAPVVQAYPELWRLVYDDPNDGPRIYQRVGPRPLAESAASPPPATPQR
jgi:hypothetical protein